MHDLLKSQFVGTHELRKNLSSILDGLAREGREVVITQQGKPTAVIVDLEKYIEVQEALTELSDPSYLAELLEAKREVRAGEGIDAEDVFRHKGL